MYATAAPTSSRERATQMTQERGARAQNFTAIENALYAGVAAADGTFYVGVAQAQRSFLIAEAEAEAAYQLDLVNEVTGAQDTYTEALADAELALIVGSSGAAGLADVVLLWQLTIADLDKAYLDDMAEESLAAVLAELEIDRAYAAGLASADEALLNADDLARVDRWLDEVNADSALRTAQAGALRDFQSELYEANVQANQAQASALGNTSDAEHQVDLALRQQRYWEGDEPTPEQPVDPQSGKALQAIRHEAYWPDCARPLASRHSHDREIPTAKAPIRFGEGRPHSRQAASGSKLLPCPNRLDSRVAAMPLTPLGAWDRVARRSRSRKP